MSPLTSPDKMSRIEVYKADCNGAFAGNILTYDICMRRAPIFKPGRRIAPIYLCIAALGRSSKTANCKQPDVCYFAAPCKILPIGVATPDFRTFPPKSRIVWPANSHVWASRARALSTNTFYNGKDIVPGSNRGWNTHTFHGMTMPTVSSARHKLT